MSPSEGQLGEGNSGTCPILATVTVTDVNRAGSLFLHYRDTSLKGLVFTKGFPKASRLPTGGELI